ncbi:MAG: SAM-dependent chlorinase/fluorinase [Saprospiraceae bacterium]
MTIVTLTTDFGTRDAYVGALKGAMLSRHRDLQFVDITHEIPAFDIVSASFTLNNCWDEFPEGTIHIISVNPFVEIPPRFVLASYGGHYFIAPDNGIFSLLFPRPLKEAVELEINPASTFPQKIPFANAVAGIAAGKSLNALGTPIKELDAKFTLQPVVNQQLIRGTVIHQDRYGNVVTNISMALFDSVCKGRPFSILFRNHKPLFKIVRNYNSVAVGETLALFNDFGLLEIAMNMDNAALLLDMKLDDTVQINFDTPENTSE